jgi:hypothetical protein
MASGTIRLMNAPIAGYFFWITNINATPVTVDPVSVCACLLNGGGTSLLIPTRQVVTFWSDGTNYFSSIPLVGGTGVTVAQSGQQLVASYTGSLINGWCQGR